MCNATEVVGLGGERREYFLDLAAHSAVCGGVIRSDRMQLLLEMIFLEDIAEHVRKIEAGVTT